MLLPLIDQAFEKTGRPKPWLMLELI
jgi:hypothetical protein